MTPREIVAKWIETEWLSHEPAIRDEEEAIVSGLVSDIERAINAAVEDEREACAKIIHDVYLAWVEGDYSPGEAFESAKEKIRYGARSNPAE